MPIDTVKLPDQLRLQPKAHFYLVNDATPSAPRLNQILGKIEAKRGVAIVHQEPVRDYAGAGAKATFVILTHESEPSFLEGSEFKETRYAIVVVVAVPQTLGVLTAGGFAWSDSLMTKDVQSVSAEHVATLIGDKGTFEKLQSRGMSISRNDIRRRAYEAVDLAASLSPLGLSRQIVQTLRVRTGGRTYNTSPTTGLVAESADRRSLEKYVHWVAEIAKELAASRERAGFLRYFAQPLDMAALPTGVTPNGVLLDLDWLIDGVQRGELAVHLVRGKGRLRLPAKLVAEQARVFAEVGETSQPGGPGTPFIIAFPGLDPRFNVQLRLNKASFSLHERLLSRLHVVSRDGSSDDSIGERLHDENALFVTTTDVRYAFAFGRLFRDDRVQSLAGAIGSMLKETKGLKRCTSEKGESLIGIRSTSFPDKSVFRVVENEIASDEKLLICDDMGDEWADYIGVRPADHRITLYHAKHGDSTTSASAFHEVIGQAIKNLGRLEVVEEDLRKKQRFWTGKWKPRASRIARVRRGKSARAFITAYLAASSAPAKTKRVAIVTSFASKKDVLVLPIV